LEKLQEDQEVKMNWLLLAIVASVSVLFGFLFGRLATYAAARRHLEQLFDEHEQTWCRLLGRLNPHPWPLGWTCNAVQAARQEVGIRLDLSKEMIQLGREHLAFDREIAERLAGSLGEHLEAATALLDYCEEQVLPLIGRVRDVATSLHGEVEMLIGFVADHYDALAARGIQAGEEQRKISMIRNASSASRTNIAAAPVTTMKLLRTQLEIVHELLRTADILDSTTPPEGGK
jgi:hypothetical protein